MERVILHVDLNNFFASVECLDNPSIKNLPVVVCGEKEQRHGVVLAKNEIAKKAGVQTGDVIWQAKKKVANLVCVKCHYEKYVYYSKLVRKIYEKYTDLVENFGIDECWLDVTASQKIFGSGEEIAEKIRQEVREKIGLTVSVGVSFNKVFAKLGSDLKKPDAVTVISKENFKQIVWPLSVENMLFVGRKTKEKLNKLNIFTIGDLAQTPQKVLEQKFGKNGKTLFEYANGLENSPVAKSDFKSIPKSVSNSITTIRNLENLTDVKVVLALLCQNIAKRLKKHNLKANVISVCARSDKLEWEGRQEKVCSPTFLSSEILAEAYKIFKESLTQMFPIRTLSVSASALQFANQKFEQIDFFASKNEIKKERCEKAIDFLNEKFGDGAVGLATVKLDEKIGSAIFKDRIEEEVLI